MKAILYETEMTHNMDEEVLGLLLFDDSTIEIAPLRYVIKFDRERHSHEKTYKVEWPDKRTKKTLMCTCQVISYGGKLNKYKFL